MTSGRRVALPVLTGVLLVLGGCGGGTTPGAATTPAPRGWVDQTLASLTLRQKVAQLVIEWMPGGYVAPSAPDFQPLEQWVVHEEIGGLSPSIGTPLAYVAKLDALQKLAKIPLLVCADFENGGPGMRINGAYALPSMLPAGRRHAVPAHHGLRRHR